MVIGLQLYPPPVPILSCVSFSFPGGQTALCHQRRQVAPHLYHLDHPGRGLGSLPGWHPGRKRGEPGSLPPHQATRRAGAGPGAGTAHGGSGRGHPQTGGQAGWEGYAAGTRRERAAEGGGPRHVRGSRSRSGSSGGQLRGHCRTHGPLWGGAAPQDCGTAPSGSGKPLAPFAVGD